jgi:predicted dehydrogenase
MKFALIGDDPDILPLTSAIAASQTHRLDCAALIGSLDARLRKVAPALRVLPRWDAILTAGQIDAVLVCGSDDLVLEAARQVASAGNRLLILPRSAQGSTWIYELSLIRDEGNAWIAPIFVDRALPGFQRIRAALDAGLLGRPLYLRIDREIRAESDAAGPVLPKETVEDALLHDVDLLRYLGGDYSRVTAGWSGANDDRVAAAAITLSGEDLPEATWMARGTTSPPRWGLVIAGEKGEISVSASGDPVAWSVRTERISGAPPDLDASLWSDEGPAVFAAIERLLPRRADTSRADSRRSEAEGSPERTDAAAWTDLVRAFEVIDAARVSVRRRRAIDLHSETASERNLFKSQMTALGCLTLTLTLVGGLFLLLLMPMLDARSRDQIEAERAGAIVRRSEFNAQGAALHESGIEHLRQLAPHMGETRFPVLIEPTAAADDPALNQKRRDVVIDALKKQGVDDAAQRTQIVPIVGEWYPQALRILRVLVFAPLALFLVLQFFVFLTRPGAR